MAARLIIKEDIVGQEEPGACTNAQASWMTCLFLHLSISNLSEIECVYGPVARESAFDLLLSSVRQLLGTERIEEHRALGTVEVTLRLRADCGDHLAASIAEEIRVLMMTTPLSAQADLYMAVPRVTSAIFEPGRNQRDAARSKAHAMTARLHSPIRQPIDVLTYWDHMNRSAMLLTQLARGRAAFVRQAILATAHAPSILYQENLLRIWGEDGELRSCEQDIKALEHLDISYELDCRLVSNALDQLETCHDLRLGVNISARSATLHGFGQGGLWHDMLGRLKKRRQVAERLVIEITESADFPSIEKALEFVQTVQHLGVRIAMDDFGSGTRTIHQLAILNADIIKVDGAFVQGASRSSKEFATFLHLVRLSSTLGSMVVVEGIETTGQADMARKAGAAGLQGFLLGKPAGAFALPGSTNPTNIMHFERFRARHMRHRRAISHAAHIAQTSERESHAQD